MFVRYNQDVNPPKVDFAFKDVQSAKEEKEQKINQALGYQNDIIPKARVKRNNKLEYLKHIVKKELLEHKEVSRFLSVLKEYGKQKM